VKPIPEIDPELHGLLDEIVKDPRSSLRLTPRRALRYWFDSDEHVRRPIDATTAERHLLAVHREAVAKLLLDAAWICYWKGSVLSYTPRIQDPSTAERGWRLAATKRLNSAETSELRAVFEGNLIPGHAAQMAAASLAMSPSDDARYAVATTGQGDPAADIHLLRVIASRTKALELAHMTRNTLGKRLCAAGDLEGARTEYSLALSLEGCSGYRRTASLLSAVNLSCFMGDASGAMRLLEAWSPCSSDPDARSIASVLMHWALTRALGERTKARMTHARLTKFESALAEIGLVYP
jgi:hypothetical protein